METLLWKIFKFINILLISLNYLKKRMWINIKHIWESLPLSSIVSTSITSVMKSGSGINAKLWIEFSLLGFPLDGCNTVNYSPNPALHFHVQQQFLNICFYNYRLDRQCCVYFEAHDSCFISNPISFYFFI